jgi:hypothetical protein
VFRICYYRPGYVSSNTSPCLVCHSFRTNARSLVLLRFLLTFPSHSRQILGKRSEIGHDSFLHKSLHITIFSFHSTLHNLAVDATAFNNLRTIDRRISQHFSEGNRLHMQIKFCLQLFAPDVTVWRVSCSSIDDQNAREKKSWSLKVDWRHEKW